MSLQEQGSLQKTLEAQLWSNLHSNPPERAYPISTMPPADMFAAYRETKAYQSTKESVVAAISYAHQSRQPEITLQHVLGELVPYTLIHLGERIVSADVQTNPQYEYLSYRSTMKFMSKHAYPGSELRHFRFGRKAIVWEGEEIAAPHGLIAKKQSGGETVISEVVVYARAKRDTAQVNLQYKQFLKDKAQGMYAPHVVFTVVSPQEAGEIVIEDAGGDVRRHELGITTNQIKQFISMEYFGKALDRNDFGQDRGAKPWAPAIIERAFPFNGSNGFHSLENGMTKADIDTGAEVISLEELDVERHQEYPLDTGYNGNGHVLSDEPDGDFFYRSNGGSRRDGSVHSDDRQDRAVAWARRQRGKAKKNGGKDDRDDEE